jgi:hypothetical protein
VGSIPTALTKQAFNIYQLYEFEENGEQLSGVVADPQRTSWR